MRSRILPLLLITFCTNTQALDFPVEVVEFMDSARVVAALDAADIHDSARWQPFETAPPLSLVDALHAVHEHLAGDPDLADSTLAGIELKQIPHHKGHWHYLVRMQTHTPAGAASRYFIVLMNGKVIPGLREPQAVK
jgi:hypothetical protein